jgi:zinc protease
VTAEIRDPKNVAKVEQIMHDEVEGLAASKIDDKEVERWRAGQLKQLELAIADSHRLALELSEYIAQGDWRTIFAYRDQVMKVTAADVSRVAKAYLVSSNRTTGRFLPTPGSTRAPLTETPDIATVVKGIEGGDVKEQGEAFVATPDSLEARTTRKELKGGTKAAFLPKKTRGGKVQLVVNLHFGDEKSLQGKRAIAELAGAMLGRGTTKKSYQDLQDAEDLLKARIVVGSDASDLAIHIETLRDKLPAALALAAEMVRSPSFPAKELELVKQEQLATLQQQLQDPEALASVTARQIAHPWPKTDPRYTPTAQEQIDEIGKVSLADIKAFYAGYVGGGHGELAVVGDFDAEAIGGLYENLFADWTAKKPYARLVDRAFGSPGQAKTIDVKDKENAQLVVEQDVAMRDSDPDYPAWVVLGQVLGGDNASRVWQRLREKGGLSYGAYAWTFADARDEVGGLGAEAIVAPQNAAKAKAALIEEIGRLASGTFTKEEVEEAKTSHLKSEETQWSSDRSVLGALAHGLEIGRTYKHSTELRTKIAAVTAADVERVAKKYIHPERLIVIEAGDQAKAKAAKP